MSLRTVRRTAELRALLREERRQGRSVGLVPTMGALHDGHVSLMRRAREECAVVVVSLFVNPTQFDQVADLDSYPRDEARDAGLAADVGVDVLFAPPRAELYPPGFATTVSVSGLTERLEGAHRGRGHFEGVTTVVTKLLNIVAPDVAYFGEKDAQQAAVIRQLVRDLDLPIRIALCPTVREPDGLAKSSRNVHLSPDERRRARALYRALGTVRDAVLAGERDPAAATAEARRQLADADVALDYLELVRADDLTPLEPLEGEVTALVAGRLGSTRLIDNLTIRLPAPHPRPTAPVELLPARRPRT